MNKLELISAIAESTGKTKKDSEAFVNAFVNVITETLANDEEVNLHGLGKFTVSERAARIGHNPQNGEEIKIPEMRVPKFKFSSTVKTAINE